MVVSAGFLGLFSSPMFHFLPLESASHLHKTSATWLGLIQCHEDAVGSGGRLLSPLGHLSAGQFLHEVEPGLPGTR